MPTETIETQIQTFAVTGMTCAACSARIERKLHRIEGVRKASVNLATETATVEFDPAVRGLNAFVENVETLGYGVLIPNPATDATRTVADMRAERQAVRVRRHHR